MITCISPTKYNAPPRLPHKPNNVHMRVMFSDGSSNMNDLTPSDHKHTSLYLPFSQHSCIVSF